MNTKTARTDSRVAADTASGNVSSTRRSLPSFVLAVLFTAVVFAAGWTVLGACGLRTPFGTIDFSWCHAAASSDPIVAESDRARVLGEQIAQLERALRHPARCGSRVAITKPPRVEPPKPAQQCPPGRVAQLPKNAVIVIDTSYSMKTWLRRTARSRREARISRIDAAKTAVIQAVRQAPKEVRIGLVSFAGCRRDAKDHGIYAYKQRGSLIREVQALRLSGGTPLAKAMLQTHAQLSRGASPDDPVNMVVITDGREACGGKPCAVARTLKNQTPGLVINVLELTGRPVVKCVAEITGGFHRIIGDRIDLDGAIREATGFEGEGLCRSVR